MTAAVMKMRISRERDPEFRNEFSGMNERPGWIPPEITENWDRDPYSYQTEEELMPAGGLHGYLMSYIIEILRNFIETQEQMLLADTFMLYRDHLGVKQRISPDLLLMPLRFPPPSAYDLDTEPPPAAVVEITSPKSRLRDLKDKVLFYTRLGIPAYLVIDAVTSRAELREHIGIYLWRKIGGRMQQIYPDTQGYLELPEMNVKVKAEGQRIIFADAAGGEILHDAGQLKMTMLKERYRADREQLRADKEQRRADSEKLRADIERCRAEAAEKKVEQTREETVKQMAASLLKIGTDLKIVSQITGLSEENLRQLTASGSYITR